MRFRILCLIVPLVAAACGNAAETTPRVSLPETTTTSTSAADPTPISTTTVRSADTTTPTTTTMTPEPVGSIDDLELELIEVASGFAQPVLMLSDNQRWFVVDQPGVVWQVSDGETSVFVDISDQVRFSGEQGLLGMALHPDFAANGLFYLSFNNNSGDSVVASMTANGGAADVTSQMEILRLEQPAGNHNGGMITFGPDENLWIGLGDGGGANDQFGNGQRPDRLLGSMLRIRVGPGINGYEIPDGNLQDEVWAIGLRNPWRFTFDGDDLWIADVGQNLIEEVDVVTWSDGNPNFGWSIMEGTDCFGSTECDRTDLVLPVYEYPHGEGCSITGGVVYRGRGFPSLSGQFFFSDYCTGWLRSVDRTANERVVALGNVPGAIGFGRRCDGRTVRPHREWIDVRPETWRITSRTIGTVRPNLEVGIATLRGDCEEHRSDGGCREGVGCHDDGRTVG